MEHEPPVGILSLPALATATIVAGAAAIAIAILAVLFPAGHSLLFTALSVFIASTVCVVVIASNRAAQRRDERALRELAALRAEKDERAGARYDSDGYSHGWTDRGHDVVKVLGERVDGLSEQVAELTEAVKTLTAAASPNVRAFRQPGPKQSV